MRVLVVEDEPKIAAFIQKGLQEELYTVDVARDGEEGLEYARSLPYDLIVLDILLPRLDGVSLCRQLRRNKIQTPVLMLTAKDALQDRIDGLDSGADDYLVKPFAFRELLARLRALARRPPKVEGSVLQVADLAIETSSHRVTRAGQQVELTPKEYAVLEYLLRHRNQVLSRDMIADCIWALHDYTESNVIDVYIRNLRRKLDDGFAPKLIHTVRGVGYMLVEPGTASESVF